MKYISIIVAALLVTSVASAEPVGGPKVGGGLLMPGRTDRFSMRLIGHESTDIRVEGDNDGDLDCTLLDEFGNIVDDDADRTDICMLTVVPGWTGQFTLVITNNGHVADRYFLVAR